ncbi:PaaI family thioesterase [Actinomadura fibrosa]|uniref:Acyl-coenzyme A thioesterase THEM4 n=1 Tax=Actinomadura fibrosa TaxID=111802 RepID=A0ABW2XWC0_9ACTN|nr:hotdog domain-containing protein [Actinomadura fibrosa]
MTDPNAREDPPAEHPDTHPGLVGRAAESEALADAVRRLIVLCTATTAPAEATMAAARGLNAIADALERHVPDPPLPKTLLHDPADGQADFGTRMPFDTVIGRHNPLALPLDLALEPPKAVLTGTFTRPYEGPPGCVHGAVLAASFDLVFAAANVIARLPGPTARLEIVYRRPTALGVPCRFEGEVESQDGRRVRTVGRLVQGDRVTVEATGDFVFLDRAAIARMAERLR